VIRRRRKLRGNIERGRIAVLVVIGFLLFAATILAQSGGSYDLTWNTVDAGGATWSSGGSYILGGTIGQPDAGRLTAGAYTLVGGLWEGAAAKSEVYLPLVLRNL
jgi:hypothetical protein